MFSVYRRTSECPLYRIEKCPKLARRQGAYSVVAATGLVLKRGGDLGRVLEVLEKRVRLVEPGTARWTEIGTREAALRPARSTPGPSDRCIRTRSSQRPCL